MACGAAYVDLKLFSTAKDDAVSSILSAMCRTRNCFSNDADYAVIIYLNVQRVLAADRTHTPGCRVMDCSAVVLHFFGGGVGP